VSKVATMRIGIALLCAAAAVLIVVILTASDYRDESGRAIAFAIAIAFATLTASAGSNLIDRQPGIAPIGYLTILAGVVFLVASANLIWSDSVLTSEGAGQAVVYTLIGAFALGSTSALFAGHDDADPDSVKLVRVGTVMALWALAITGIADVQASGDRTDPRQVGITAVLFGLGALVLPLLCRVER